MKPFITISRPLGDKTPFPNRVANDAQSQTPSPLNEKLAKLSLEEPGPAIVPGALLRPSSARTSLRIPRTSGGKYEFKTPITQGNHWDVSDGDIDVEPEIQPDEQEAVQEEDYDEIEYMPPTAISECSIKLLLKAPYLICRTQFHRTSLRSKCQITRS